MSRRLGVMCVALLSAGSGCEQLFSLDHVDLSDSGLIDAPAADAAPACVSATLHDEDGDGVKDDCDQCPTVTSTPIDSDGDGLADECDPNLSTSMDGDRIVFQALFASSTELATLFDTSGTGMAASVASDRLVLPVGAQAALKTTAIPTRMVLEVASLSGATKLDGLEFAQNGVSCSVTGAGCAGESGSACVTFGSVVTQAFSLATVKRISVSRVPGGGLVCQIDAGTASFNINTTGTFTNSVPFVRAVGNGQAEIQSFVIYGEK